MAVFARRLSFFYNPQYQNSEETIMKMYIDQQIHDAIDQWHSYAYLGIGSHEYHLCRYSKSGGYENAPYVTADDSLWTIDTPESPRSILALIIPSTLETKVPPLDLRNTTISFSLRGDNLKLYGATCYFWVVTFLPLSTRWHYVTQPLTVPEGSWSDIQSLTLRNDEKLWHCSFSLANPRTSLNDTLEVCMSFGFSFVGFSEKVTGKFSLSEFTINKNLNTDVTYFANFHKFQGWLTLSRKLGRQITAPVDTYGRVVLLSDDNYVVLSAQGIYYLYLAFIHQKDSTKKQSLHNKSLYFMLGWKELAPKPYISYAGGNMHFFIENTATSTIWISKQPISQDINIGKLLLRNEENEWFCLTGNASLHSVIMGSQGSHGYDYLGLMLVGIDSAPIGYWTLAEFSIA